jgi:SNF2 family DNA or RNA helicase
MSVGASPVRVELPTWQRQPHWVASGSAESKRKVIEAFSSHIALGGDGWLVVNPDPVRYRETFSVCLYHVQEFDPALDERGEFKLSPDQKKIARQCPDCETANISEFPFLHKMKWAVIIIDECHKNAVRNPNTLTAKGMFGLKLREGGVRYALSGTPMGGKIMNLYGILHFLNPKVFSSKWRFAEQWVDVTAGEYGKSIGECIKHCEEHFGHDDEIDGRPDCAACLVIEDAFYEMLAPYMTRRTKAEALPWLPPKHFIPVWCDWGSDRHRKQYAEFAEESFTLIDGEGISGANILSEYMRLKQFAFGRHERRGDKLVPTLDSGKIEAMQELLEELGIWDGLGDEQVVIFSQFSEVVDLVTEWLRANGIKVAKITGAVNKAKTRAELREAFQSEDIQAIVMTTTAGGVSITLDRASNVFILDETWDPDDQEQAEDRCHRASRIHQVTVYYFRTRDSIEEMIAEVTGTKFARNVRVLDGRRLRAKMKAAT